MAAIRQNQEQEAVLWLCRPCQQLYNNLYSVQTRNSSPFVGIVVLEKRSKIQDNGGISEIDAPEGDPLLCRTQAGQAGQAASPPGEQRRQPLLCLPLSEGGPGQGRRAMWAMWAMWAVVPGMRDIRDSAREESHYRDLHSVPESAIRASARCWSQC